MAESSQNNKPFSGWSITKSNYKNNQRYFLLEQKAIFKTIRLAGSVPIFTEIINELVCHALGKRLGIPIVNTILGVLPTKGIGLFSILLGEQPFNPSDTKLKSSISNILKLKNLFVFDQWINNDDRKAEHIMIGTEPISPDVLVLYGYDHGHTLNGYDGKKWTLETLTDDILKTPGQVQFDSDISSYSELGPTISQIQEITDEEIDKVIGDAESIILEFNVPTEEMNRVNTNGQVIRKILKSRRDYLVEIVKTWCKKNNKGS